jgi:hypothetical protein
MAPLTDDEIADIIAADIAYLNDGADPNGCEPVGSEFCVSVGFDVQRFEGYLWRSGQTCWISLVVSKQPGQGHFSELLNRLRARGFEVRVPNPAEDMQGILRHKGFSILDDDPLMWVSPWVVVEAPT